MNDTESLPIQDQTNEATPSYQPIAKHSYPVLVSFLMIFSTLLFLILVPTFIWIDLPKRHELYFQIKMADDLFAAKQYLLAGCLYDGILKEYPNFEKANTRMVKICFALIPEDTEFYTNGLSYLTEKTYTKTELKDLETFLPEHYKEDFRSHFKERA